MDPLIDSMGLIRILKSFSVHTAAYIRYSFYIRGTLLIAGSLKKRQLGDGSVNNLENGSNKELTEDIQGRTTFFFNHTLCLWDFVSGPHRINNQCFPHTKAHRHHTARHDNREEDKQQCDVT